MKPSPSYKARQAKLTSLIEKSDQSVERTRIKRQLEREFVAAWQLGPDRLRLGASLSDAIRLFTTKDGECVRGFDHCTYYTGENDQRIIVTQPYNTLISDIEHDLTLDDCNRPEIIDATDWAFYYPGHAALFIVKFPPNFKKAMDNFESKMRRAENEKLLQETLN